MKIRKIIKLAKCIFCGWDKAECDAHRIIYGCNGGQYTTNNVVPVCPNCHRLIHRGLLKIN
ncbi:MAG: HNH endonuclease [Thermoplasmata archaeon]|nr:HNH endonuclease [Thermoplasmata archaeon]